MQGQIHMDAGLDGAVQVDSINTRFFKRLWFQRLKLQYDEPRSNFAFTFNLRRCAEAPVWACIIANFVNNWGQGLTLVHFSAQVEPFLRLKTCPKQPLNTPCPTKSAYVKLTGARV
jgi:hypothetical protein